MASPFSIPGVTAASRLERPAASLVSCGIGAIDELTGGLPRGALTEICGPPSSGRTTLLMAVLAQAARVRQELCALVDASDSFDPQTAELAGVDLERLLWVRCGGKHPPQRHRDTETIRESEPGSSDLKKRFRAGAASSQITNYKSQNRNEWLSRTEQALKATDLLLQGGGFGLVVVDLADVPVDVARCVPLASWFRFRRAVEHTPAVLIAVEQEPYAKTCASLVLKTAVDHQPSAISTPEMAGQNSPSHAQLFRGLAVEVEIMRARDRKKPARSTGRFEGRAEWA